MSEPDVVERVRMAVAEAGYDPGLVWREGGPDVAFNYDERLPDEVAWRAYEIVREGWPTCRSCHADQAAFERKHGRWPNYECQAEQWLTEDCGVDR